MGARYPPALDCSHTCGNAALQEGVKSFLRTERKTPKAGAASSGKSKCHLAVRRIYRSKSSYA
jgi:hypothetical protein